MADLSIDFDKDEAAVIAVLRERYKADETIEVDDICKATRLPVENVKEILLRFNRYGMVSPQNRGGRWKIEPNLLAVAGRLSTPPDYWKKVEVWFRSRWWSVPVIFILVVLPAIAAYIQMLSNVLKWFGGVEAE